MIIEKKIIPCRPKLLNMKRNLLVFFTTLFLMICANQIIAQNLTGRNCGTMSLLAAHQMADPSIAIRRQNIENQTQNYATHQFSRTEAGVVTIPVVFHVVYKTAAQNISDAQCIAQIAQLNLDYARKNADTTNTPTAFRSLGIDTKIQFCLAQRDPNGLATTGIIHKSTTSASFIDDDKVKSSTTGGDNAWSSSNYLNIWVCNLGNSLLGYAQFPGDVAATDGVVLLYSSVGSVLSPGTAAPYQYGRTATHEVGHWLNLYHIWGDASCGNDLVNDTPTQSTSNSGCPTYPHRTCSNTTSGDMYMNYMDYTDDGCMNIFTSGQTARMNALFATGGSRVSLLSSNGCLPVSSTCSIPTGLASSAITSSGSTLAWTAVTGAASYSIQYRIVGAATWTSTTSTTTSKALTGLTASSNYEFQVKTVCSATSSSAFTASATFTTTAVVTSCNLPTALTSASITSSGATVSWTAATGAISYNVQYRIVGAATWTSTTSTTTSKVLTGLTASSNYEFQLQTVCSATSSSAFTASATFTTAAVVTTCNLPTALTSASITSSGATISWTAATGAISYNVQYRIVGAATWTSTTSTTTSSILTGLTASSNYEFQVKTVCSATSSSAFTASATFTTTAATVTCTTPSGLTSSSITSSNATISWTAISGALSYNIRYRIVGAATWIAATSTTATLSLSGLAAISNYEYQVQTVCSASTSSPFSTSSTFTTLAATTCSDTYESNNTSATATALTANTSISALINTASDVDWYSFSTIAPATNVKISLTGLPADYDVSLYNSSLTLLGSSQNTGTTAEQIISNTATAGTYYVKVNGFNAVSLANYNFSAGTANAASAATRLTASALLQGNNNGTTTLITTASASTTYTGASGTSNAGVAARTGVLNTAASGSAYFEFTLTPTAGNIVTLTGISFGSRSTSTGPLAYAIRSSLDAYTANIATGTLTNTSAWSLFSNSGLSFSSTAGTAVTFRIYGYNGTGTASANTANWRIDDLTLTGSVNAFNATQCYSLLASTGSTSFRFASPSTNNNITVYPNPAKSFININYNSSKTAQTSLQIIDQLGRVVLNKTTFVNNGKNNLQLNTSTLTPGMYFIRLNNEINSQIQKFVIE